MKVALLDANVLIALAWPSHIHHEAAHTWFTKEQHYGWATCPITQSALVRLSSNSKIFPNATTPTEALSLLNALTKHPHHQFWADDISLASGIAFQQNSARGHRQVTDAYLYSLAIHKQGRLVTFDDGIASLYPEAATTNLLVLTS